MTIKTMPAISTLRSVEIGFGVGPGTVVFFRGVGVLVVLVDLEREDCAVVFLGRPGVLVVVPGLFLLPEVFFVLLVVLLCAIAILLTFP